MTDHSYSTGLPIISIAGVEITTDAEGRYNLNALHKASKLGPKKDPAHWMRNKQAKELIAQIEAETTQICIVSDEGRNGGTFAHELLAVSYAGWISPAFQLKVNQAFLDMKSGARSRQMTPAEMFLHNAQMMVAIEQRQAAQAAALQTVRDEIKVVSNAHVILDKMPTDCESIERIRERIGKATGLSHAIITKVVRDTPYAPTVRVLVRNPHVDADGSHYSGFAKKEITAIFKRFVSECVQVTPTMCTHPYIEGRFRLVKEAE
ncbi:KilA-N domain-containing protein [Brucella intermedia]|uniref:KilA-N domain-containing protein n=1 Tax=Brucella intermedia TaxID=94625 RepID=UPI001FFE9BD0|nr:KilA-N domain-containing protein [Brucella intermedia]